ncbi:MAG: (2Fe-2S) ferredoxin domain-containing protein [archaeon]
METFKPTQTRLILVCCNQKDVNDSTLCGNREGLELHAELKAYVKSKNLQMKVRVVKSGCLDYCGLGPVISIEPEHIWYKGVTKDDLAQIKKDWIDPLVFGQDIW